MSRSPFHRLRNTRMHGFPRLVCVGAEHTALVVMKYNGVSRSCITNRGRSRSHRAYTFDWIIRNRPASSRARNRLPCLDRETNLQFKLHFRVSRYNWGPAHRETAHRRSEVMVRSRFMPNRSREIDQTLIHASPSHRIASRVCEVEGRRWPHSVSRILRPFFDYHTVSDNSDAASSASEEERGKRSE